MRGGKISSETGDQEEWCISTTEGELEGISGHGHILVFVMNINGAWDLNVPWRGEESDDLAPTTWAGCDNADLLDNRVTRSISVPQMPSSLSSQPEHQVAMNLMVERSRKVAWSFKGK